MSFREKIYAVSLASWMDSRCINKILQLCCPRCLLKAGELLVGSQFRRGNCWAYFQSLRITAWVPHRAQSSPVLQKLILDSRVDSLSRCVDAQASSNSDVYLWSASDWTTSWTANSMNRRCLTRGEGGNNLILHLISFDETLGYFANFNNQGEKTEYHRLQWSSFRTVYLLMLSQ